MVKIPLPDNRLWRGASISDLKKWWDFGGIVVLAALFVLVLTKVGPVASQKYAVVILFCAALVHFWRTRTGDFASLLSAVLSMWLLYSLYRAESLSLYWMMVLAGLLAAYLTFWQGMGRFSKETLGRHAYLVGILTAQTVIFFAYWSIYDDTLGKAILSTLILYVVWGCLDAADRGTFNWKTVASFGSLALLLAILVLATMNPVVGLRVHP